MTVDDNTVIFADGSRYRFVGSTATDVVLSPLFLKFFTICVLIFALLHRRSDLAALNPWQLILLYLIVGAAVVVWIYVLVWLAIWLRHRGIIQSLYTPFISVTSILASELAIQTLLGSFFAASGDIVSVPLKYIIQPMVVIFLMDILFAHAVAAHHPSFVRLNSAPSIPTASSHLTDSPAQDTSAVTTPLTAPSDDKADTPAPSNAKTPDTPAQPGSNRPARKLVLNNEEVSADDIRVMRIEDHYLLVETTRRSLLVRYKISAAVEQIDPDLGLQINRSVWVARSAIRAVYRTQSYGADVVLDDGTEYTVSRSRIASVLDTLKRWDIDIDRRDDA